MVSRRPLVLLYYLLGAQYVTGPGRGVSHGDVTGPGRGVAYGVADY